MFKLSIALVAVVTLGVGAYFLPHKEEYINPITEVIEKEVVKEVNPLDEKIAAREAELTEKYENIKRLEARVDVLKGERTRLDEEIKGLQKELAGFMTATTSGR